MEFNLAREPGFALPYLRSLQLVSGNRIRVGTLIFRSIACGRTVFTEFEQLYTTVSFENLKSLHDESKRFGDFGVIDLPVF